MKLGSNLSKKKLVAALVAALVAFLGALAGTTITNGPNGPVTVTVEVGGPHGTPTTTITTPAAAVEQAEASSVAGHDGMKDETPAGAPSSAIEAAREQQDALAATDQLPIVTPNAAPEQRGCVTRLVQNYSSRRGVRPRIFVLHYTVSHNVRGWGDVNAIVSIFDRPSFAASSNYVIDGEGHCAYIVRESDKAWAQAAMNPVAISVEVVDMGSEKTYLAPAGLKKLAMVASDALKRWDIPVQQGIVRNGVVVRAGIVDHGSLGAVGGGHHDIAPFKVGPVIAAIKSYRASSVSKPKASETRPASKSRTLPKCKTWSLQHALKLRGARLVVDGVMGPHTRAAIVAWQKAHRPPLYPSGKVGSALLATLGLKGRCAP